MKKTVVTWAGLALFLLLAGAPRAGAQVETIEIDVAGYLCGL